MLDAMPYRQTRWTGSVPTIDTQPESRSPAGLIFLMELANVWTYRRQAAHPYLPLRYLGPRWTEHHCSMAQEASSETRSRVTKTVQVSQEGTKQDKVLSVEIRLVKRPVSRQYFSASVVAQGVLDFRCPSDDRNPRTPLHREHARHTEAQ